MNIASVSAANGLERTSARLDQSAARIATSAQPEDAVSLSSEVVGLLQTKQQATTDLNLLHVSDTMEKTALQLI